MTQALALSPDQIRAAQQDDDTDAIPDAFLDYVELQPNLIQRGWGTATAKSEEYDKVDQSMLQHVGNAVMALVRLYELTDAVSEDKLRMMIALMVAHDYHKLRDADGTPEQFDITTDEVNAFIDAVGLDDYVGGPLDPELVKGAMVALHDYDDRSRTEEPPAAYDDYRPYLDFADGVASTPHPSEFTDLSKTHSLRDALGPDYTINHHEVARGRGLVTNIINQSMADVLADRGYDLFAIYHNGCTYLGDDRCAEIPIDDAFIDTFIETFFENLRTAHPAFQSPDSMDGALPLNRYRYYDVSDRDFVFATPADIVRGMVQRGVADAHSKTDIPDTVQDGINRVAPHTDMDIERTRHVDGIARLIHTVRAEIAPELAPDTDPLDVVCDLFNITRDTYEATCALRAHDESLVTGTKQWPVKYLLAQDVVDRHFPGRPDEIIATLSDTLLGACDEYAGWDSLADHRARDLKDELIAFLLYNVQVDGRRLIRETGGRDEYDRNYDRSGQHTCSLCNYPTSVTPTDGFRLLKSYPTDLSLTHYDGEERTLRQVANTEGYQYCLPCQLDLALRLTRQEAAGVTDTSNTDDESEDRLYVHIMPDYFFTPMLWCTYRQVFDAYFSVNTTDSDELIASVFATDAASGYQSWLADTLDSDTGPNLLYDLDGAFNPDMGFGTHAISRKKPRDITETEELFITLAAAAYAGVRVYVTDSPITRVKSDDFDTAIKLDDSFDITRYTGTNISLTDLRDVLSSIAAMKRLATARNREGDPLEQLDNLTMMTPLPGAMLLGQLADDQPSSAPDYVDEARYLDEQVVAAALSDGDDGWPLDIRVSKRPDPVATHQAADALAATAWPCMNPSAVDKETLCAPLDAALDAIADAREDVGDPVPASDLRPRIEQAVATALDLHPRGPGRHFTGRVAAFAQTVVDDVVDRLYDGQLADIETHRNTLRNAFYAAMLELATTSLELETHA